MTRYTEEETDFLNIIVDTIERLSTTMLDIDRDVAFSLCIEYMNELINESTDDVKYPDEETNSCAQCGEQQKSSKDLYLNCDDEFVCLKCLGELNR